MMTSLKGTNPENVTTVPTTTETVCSIVMIPIVMGRRFVPTTMMTLRTDDARMRTPMPTRMPMPTMAIPMSMVTPTDADADTPMPTHR